jgi:spore coat polysaccharide biosynthesis predicted glycosyltransferase SpsG
VSQLRIARREPGPRDGARRCRENRGACERCCEGLRSQVKTRKVHCAARIIREGVTPCDTRGVLRLLFIPVSAPRGTGEYARSLAIASEISRRWQAEIHFIVSREASYADSVPFPVTRLPSSATFHTPDVAALIGSFRPDVVIFDNAGRTAQLRAARAAQARIVFVSSRARPRRRAFRMRWMRLLDEHWIAAPALIAGAPGPFERLKLRALGRPVVRYIDTLLPRIPDDAERRMLGVYELQPDRYVLVVPGGGSAQPRMREAPRAIREAAASIAAQGCSVALVGSAPQGHGEALPESLRLIPTLPMAELVALMRHACVAVVNGADTLLQAIACGKACIGVPMAPDQLTRLERLESAGLAVRAPIDAAEIERRAVDLVRNGEARRALAAKAASLNIRDGMGTVMEALASLARQKAHT